MIVRSAPSESTCSAESAKPAALRAIEPRHLERVIVDTTVQEKVVVFPGDSRRLLVAR